MGRGVSSLKTVVFLSAFLIAATGVRGQQRIDQIVAFQQAENGFPPSELCSDAVFIRRAFLDTIGTLPTAGEVQDFLKNRVPDKRRRLVDYLLEREEFADCQALKWCDLLRVKSEFPSNLWPNAVQAYHRWIRDAVRQNMPYDRFVRELLTASGSNFRDPPVNFYRPFQERTPRNILETAALVFMGIRLEHSGWSEDELLGMDAFFGKIAYKRTDEWKEEIVYFDPEKKFLHPATQMPVVPCPVGGAPLELGPFDDPRVAFADWLTSPDNPWFAKNIVNRIWYWLFGRGIIHEVDDMSPDNRPWSPELLACLEAELVESGYDLKYIYRLVLNSETYQRSSSITPDNAADEEGFSRYRLRRLDAEVLIDAINQITGATEEYSSAIPEPFTFIPPTIRTISLADGSIKSPFLEMFGRPGRDSSMESDRNNGLSVFQSLHLLNSSHIHNKIMRGWRVKKIIYPPAGQNPVDAAYLTVLSRFPTEDERAIALNYLASGDLPKDQAVRDLVWALVNTSEFVLKH